MVSPTATATSTALDAAIPTIIVSGAVATARIASAARAAGRERGTCPTASNLKMIWASRKSAGPPNVRIVKPRVVSSAGWAIASSSPTAMAMSASTISVSVHVPQYPTAPAPSAVAATSTPIASDRWKYHHQSATVPVKEIASASRRSSSNGSPVNAAPIVSTVSPRAMMKNSRKRSMSVGGHDRQPPEDEACVAVGDRAGDPQAAGEQLPGEVVHEVQARSSNASGIPTDMTRLANISPTSSSRTGNRSGSSQFIPHAVMYQP